MSLRAAFAPWALGLCLLAGAPTGCEDGGKPDVTHQTGGSAGAGGSGGTAGKSDAGGGDASADAPSDGFGPDASVAAVRVGIIPTPRHVDGGIAPANGQLAMLEVLSAGSRGVTLLGRWDELYPSPSAPDAQRWNELEAVGTLFHSSSRSLLVCLALVDRTIAARPSGLSAWNDAATRTALEALIDKTFATFGTELYALSFGHELDRWLGAASPSDRADMVALLEHGVAYARQSPARPPAALVGVTLTANAVVAGSPAEVPKLVAASDAIIVTYHPLEPSFEAKPATTAAADLDALGQASAAEPGDAADAADATPFKRVLIQELGYPSSALCKSSEAQQAAFFDSFFQAIGTRRERFPFVAVRGLHDATPLGCEAEAKALGAPANAKAIAARCSLGLKTADGTAKPAWSSASEALATFAAP